MGAVKQFYLDLEQREREAELASLAEQQIEETPGDPEYEVIPADVIMLNQAEEMNVRVICCDGMYYIEQFDGDKDRWVTIDSLSSKEALERLVKA